MGKDFDLFLLNYNRLEEFREIADPLADAAVADIFSSGYGKDIDKVFKFLGQINSSSADTTPPFDSKLLEIVEDFVQRTHQLPEWADQELIKKGEEVFSTYGLAIIMLLNVSSLPLCYTCANGSKVLFETGRLLASHQGINPVIKRLMDTAQIILDVMLPGGLMPGGKGVVSIQKVRLIHAVTRYYLKHSNNADRWQNEIYGEPINQEDMAGTLMSFAPVILSGLKHLNASLTMEQMDAYMHCWKVVGYLMGVKEELLPNSYEEGFALTTKILQHQAKESVEGKALTSSCIKTMNTILLNNRLGDVPVFLIVYFMKDFSEASNVDLCRMIGVKYKSGSKNKIVISLTQYIMGKFSHLEKDAFIRKITPPFNRILLRGLINLFNRGESNSFTIPAALQNKWIQGDKENQLTELEKALN